MAKIQDLRSITPRSNGTRNRSQVKNIARHHSGGNSGDWFTFWPFWRDSRGWGTGGYHEIIKRDGTVQHCYDDHEITNGVAGQNSGIYNICLVGNGNFTAAQEAAWDERCRAAMTRFNLPVSAVKGHNEFPGTNTACPGINMNLVRSRLKGSPVPVRRDYLIEGDNNPAVKKLQQDLNKAGTKPVLVEDGIFGAATENAVKNFQKKHGLEVDGIWGKNSAAKMTAVIEQLSKPPVKPAEKPKEDEDMPDKAIVINSEADLPAVMKLHVRTGWGIWMRNAVKDKIAKELIIAGGGTEGLKKYGDKLTDLSGKTRRITVDNVDDYMKKL